MTIVLHDFQHTVVGDAYEYCVRKAGEIITHVTEFGGVIEVVGGVVFSLTQLNIVELVVSSLTD